MALQRRIESVDVLRGVVMVLMALDHVRDFFGTRGFDPTDLTRTTVALFLTRWVTHFCAPVFMLLAGTSAFLWSVSARDGMSAASPRRGPHLAESPRAAADVSRFLATRGLWLVLLEVLFVRVAWWPAIVPRFIPLQVIWALGASMVVLALLVRLPLRGVAAVGIAMVIGHDLLDGVHATTLGSFGTAWLLLHESGPIPVGSSLVVYVAYPLVPWIGVMACGYALGPILLQEPATRRRQLATLGGAIVLAFVAVRGINLYGDRHPWTPQPTVVRTVLSFLNCSKYPPSLEYLLMTLGPALLALAALDRPPGPVLRRIAVFGKVPLFYYLCHLYLLRGGAIALDAALHGSPRPELVHNGVFALPQDYGYPLPIVYLVWLIAVVALYPACVWFANVKASHRGDWWVSYV
jgi:uncharacterized membrane protein